MIMKRYHFYSLLQRAMMALLCLASLAVLNSCVNDDEPETGIDYYLLIEARSPIYGSGEMAPPPKNHMIGILTSRMKERIHEVYPHRDMQGADASVMVVCDQVYREYQESGQQTNCECVASLYRAKMSGLIIKQSTKLKTYRF
jgi:hypothetical protein